MPSTPGAPAPAMLPPVEMLPALVGLFDEALLLVDGAGQLVWCNAQAQALLEPPVEGTAVDWADHLLFALLKEEAPLG